MLQSKTRRTTRWFIGHKATALPRVALGRELFGTGETIAREINADVREKCGLVISVGVASNKLCAKIASDLRKPDGLVVITPRNLPGVS